MLYDGLSVEEALSGKSKCRNRAVAEAFQYMKLIEGWGTGLPRLFRQCREMALPEQILIHIRRDPGITQPMLAEKLGVSRSTIQRYMRQMMKDGLIRRYGRTRGYWEAVGDQNVTGQI